jgi:N-carbamoylputrescine amidase
MPAAEGSRSSTLRLGLVQMRCHDDPQANLDRATAGIEEAARRGAGLVCLQELFRTPYFPQREDPACFELAESVPGPTTEALAKVAAAQGIVVVGSIFERRAEGLYHNTAVALDADGDLAGIYRKMHIPDDPHYYEKFYFTPGDLGFAVATTRAGRVGMLVCWDQWFPEAARLSALSAAQVIVCPTAIGWIGVGEDPSAEATEHDAWETIQRAHAIANGVFVAAVNRVGQEADIRFWGRSFVVDPFGRVLARASASDDEVLVVDCELAEIERVRRTWPFLRDRRVDAYADLMRRFRD